MTPAGWFMARLASPDFPWARGHEHHRRSPTTSRQPARPSGWDSAICLCAINVHRHPHHRCVLFTHRSSVCLLGNSIREARGGREITACRQRVVSMDITYHVNASMQLGQSTFHSISLLRIFAESGRAERAHGISAMN